MVAPGSVARKLALLALKRLWRKVDCQRTDQRLIVTRDVT
jgi:hypothetical protein